MGDGMFANYVTSKEITFKHAKGMRDVYGKEFHIFNEMFLLLSDSAKFTSDKIIDNIHVNSLVIIPSGQFHQFDHIGKESEYHRFVIQFYEIPELKNTIDEIFDNVKVIYNLSPETLTLFARLGTLYEQKISEDDKQQLLRSIFTELLIDLKYNYKSRIITKHNTNVLIQKIIEYINQNYLDEISVPSISKALNFSESYIAHKFKKVMKISIYKYILQKKLLHAHHLLSCGTSATDTASLCGFKDYCAFYKVYKKYFGISPSKTEKQKNT